MHWQAVGWGEGQTMIMSPSSRYRLGSIYCCGNACSRMGNALMRAKGNEAAFSLVSMKRPASANAAEALASV